MDDSGGYLETMALAPFPLRFVVVTSQNWVSHYFPHVYIYIMIDTVYRCISIYDMYNRSPTISIQYPVNYIFYMYRSSMFPWSSHYIPSMAGGLLLRGPLPHPSHRGAGARHHDAANLSARGGSHGMAASAFLDGENQLGIHREFISGHVPHLC
jgi:hypothetical protein